MKNLTYLLALLFVGWSASAKTTASATTNNFYNYGDSFIFVEGDVEFAVYPDGQFDFYYNPQFSRTSIVNISVPGVNISYNSGYNYDPYLQYDDYGAVIQIENVPVYYDYYGRIVQAGNIYINYNSHGLVANVGGLNIYYNMFNQPVRYVGFINRYNPRYVYRPWHRYYVRPYDDYRVVYNQPYREYYAPTRLSFNVYWNTYHSHHDYYNKHNFYRPGQSVAAYNYGRRTTDKRELRPAVRSNQNVTRRTAQNYSKENNYSKSRNAYSGRRSSGSQREVANMAKHQEAVRATRGRSSRSDVTSRVSTNRNAAGRSADTNSSRTRTVATPQRSVSRASSASTRSTTTRSTSASKRSANPARAESSARTSRASTANHSQKSRVPSTTHSNSRGNSRGRGN
ncbi:MAG: hypothetical protein WCD31_05485 [Gillisia sp.]